MVDKTKLEELQQQLLDIQAEIEELKSVKEEENVGSVLPVEGYCFIKADWSDTPFKAGCWLSAQEDQNVFPTQESAESYRDAFSVMLELRRQPGSVEYDPYLTVWYIDWKGTIDIGSTSECILCSGFISKEYAQQAIEVVGKDKIVAAYNTMLYGVTQ